VASTDGRGRTRPRLVALALLIAVGIIVAIVLGTGSSSPSRAADGSSPSSATTVQRRDLVETDSEPGALGHANPQTVYNRLSGTITWLPPIGQVIKPGQALFRIGSEPVILMNGRTPAYRDLGPSDSDAQDILELNRNLVALGFNPRGIVVDDAWQAATTAGVDALQASLGQTETGTLKLGQLVFLPGNRLVSSVSAQLGSQAALRTEVPAPEFVSLTTTGTTSEGATTPTGARTPHHPLKKPDTLAALLALLKAETAQLKATDAQLRAMQSNVNRIAPAAPKEKTNPPPASSNGGATNNNGRSNPGSTNGSGGSATAVLTTSSTQLVVTVQLDPSKQHEAKVGGRVTVEMPFGRTVGARISAVSPVGQSSNDTNSGNGGGANGDATNGSGSSTTVPVTITLRGHAPGNGLDQASVSVTFAEARAKHVLSVPVTALLATQGGRYALQEAASPHHLIPVTPALFAAGYVEISGPGIYPGLVVTDSQG
jgi:hypothetical protein